MIGTMPCEVSIQRTEFVSAGMFALECCNVIMELARVTGILKVQNYSWKCSERMDSNNNISWLKLVAVEVVMPSRTGF